MTSSRKNLITFGIIAVVVILGYVLVFKGGGDGGGDGSLLVSEPVQGGTTVDPELITMLIELRSIELDNSLFSRESFKSLKDFSIEISPQPVGRNNPFSPIGSDPGDGSVSSDQVDSGSLLPQVDGDGSTDDEGGN